MRKNHRVETMVGLPDFQMPVANDEHDVKLLADIANYRCHILHITADNRGPGFSFSVGLYLKFGHPEILVMGLPQPVAHQLINLVAQQVESGRVFRPQEEAKDLLQGVACSFISILVDHYEDYLGYGIWFYKSLKKPFPALQLVWPDQRGRYPWESTCDGRFSKLQRLLDVV